MKILLLVFLITLSACGKAPSSEVSDESFTAPEHISMDLSGEVPLEAMSFTTNLALNNFEREQEAKILQAAELVREVIASREFRNAVINHTYNGRKTFIDNRGLTNTQIYLMMLQGAEQLLPDSNNAMDVELELYYQSNATIGYTMPSTSRIWMNTKYFDSYEPYQVAGNLIHEWLHKLGFTHSSEYNSARPYSVPYAIGYIVRSMARENYTP